MGEIRVNISIPDLNRKISLKANPRESINDLYANLYRKIAYKCHYTLWNPRDKLWLLDKQQSLKYYKVDEDLTMELLTTRKMFKLILPNYTVISLSLDISLGAMALVECICQKLGILYPEELGVRRVCNIDEYQKIKFTVPSADQVTIESNIEQATAKFVQTVPEPFKDYFPNSENSMDLLFFHSLWCPATLSLKEHNMENDEFVALQYKYDKFMALGSKCIGNRLNLIFNDLYLTFQQTSRKLNEEDSVELAAILCQFFLYHRGLLEESVPLVDKIRASANSGDALDVMEHALSEIGSLNGTANLDLKDNLKITTSGALFKGSDMYDCILSGNVFNYKKNDIKSVSLEKCSVTFTGDWDAEKYSVKITHKERDMDLKIEFKELDTFSRWYLPLQLASKGEAISKELNEKGIKAFNQCCKMLQAFMDKKNKQTGNFTINTLVQKHIAKKMKIEDLIHKILTAHSNYRLLNKNDVKVAFIRKLTSSVDLKPGWFQIEMSSPEESATKKEGKSIKEYMMFDKEEMNIYSAGDQEPSFSVKLNMILDVSMIKAMNHLIVRLQKKTFYVKGVNVPLEAIMEFICVHFQLSSRTASNPFRGKKVLRTLWAR